MLYGQIEVGDGLRLDALGGVDHQQCAFAGCDGTGNLVGEIHMARSVDEVQHVVLTAAGVVHLDGVALDGDAFLLLQVHAVQHLVFHLTLVESLGAFQHTVGKSAFAVVDMGDYAKISDVPHTACKDN